MTNFIKYPSIGKFSDVLYDVNKSKRTFSHLDISEDGTKTPVFKESDLPVLEFKGTVKLHGTNAAVVINSDFTVDAQSRTRTLSIENDNHGFCNWLVGKTDVFLDEYKSYMEQGDIYSVHIFGEWCGSNVQGNVALMGIEKSFVIFGILQTNLNGDTNWLSPDDIVYLSNKENNIHSIYDFETYSVVIDMNNPSKGLEKIDKLRDDIDDVCPVAKALGSDSETTNGEGNVWRCITEGYRGLSFKHKGESHSRRGNKPKCRNPKAPFTEDQNIAYKVFIEEVVTVDRLAQGVEFIKEQGLELTHKNTGNYLKWVSSDIQKECKLEIKKLAKLGVAWCQVRKTISQMSREFYFNEITTQ
jgi:hypothetical protein